MRVQRQSRNPWSSIINQIIVDDNISVNRLDAIDANKNVVFLIDFRFNDINFFPFWCFH